MPFSLHNLSRLIAYSHHQAVQPLGATAVAIIGNEKTKLVNKAATLRAADPVTSL